MGKLKTQRFEVDESSWSYDISSSIASLLEMIPEDDVNVDVPNLLYNALTTSVFLHNLLFIYSLAIIGVLLEEEILMLLFDIYPFCFSSLVDYM